MVDPMTADRSTSPVDVFKALADPTRLAVIERLGIGPATTSELARPFAMALPSFLQHLDVLEQAGVVASYKQGRVRTYRLTPSPLERASGWLLGQRDHWTRRADQLDAHLMNITPQPQKAAPR
jgi:DNA-binding transcriptional ArsR family regulator